MEKKIKSIAEYHFSSAEEAYSTEPNDMKDFINKITEYNKEGKIINETVYGSDGEITSKFINNYNDQGNLIEDITFEGEHEIAGRTSYVYDDEGLLKKEIVHYNDDTDDEIIYIYQDKVLVEKHYIDSEGEIEQKEIFRYQGDKITKVEIVGEDHRLVSGKYFEFDKDDHLILFTFFEGDEKISEKTNYDASGRKEKVLKYGTTGRLSEIRKYSYIDDSEIIFELTEESAAKYSLYRFSYDASGRVIKQEEYDKNELLVHTFEQDYDEDGQLSEVRLFYYGFGITAAHSPIVKYSYEYYS